MQHIADGQLHALLDGALHTFDEKLARATESHLAECAACQARLEAERGVRDRAHGILSLAAPSGRDIRPFDEVIRRPAPAPRRTGRTTRAVPLVWAASIVVALGLGWLARSSMRPAEPMAEVQASAMPASDTTAPYPAAAARAASTQAEPLSQAVPEPEPTAPLAAAPQAAPASPVTPPRTTKATEAPIAALTPLADARAATEDFAGRAEAARPDSTLVRGRVTDESGRPLAGVQVQAPALAARAVTGLDGAYTLHLGGEQLSGSDSVTLTAQMVGRETERHSLPIGRGQVRAQDFRLRAATVALEALVVAGRESRRTSWTRTDRAAAEQSLGRPIQTIPGLPLLGIELGRSEGAPVVRVRHRVGRAGTLLLEQVANPGELEGELSALSSEKEAELVVRRNGLRVTARAPMSLDSLRALLRRAQ
jgi:hypothetical protein